LGRERQYHKYVLFSKIDLLENKIIFEKGPRRVLGQKINILEGSYLIMGGDEYIFSADVRDKYSQFSICDNSPNSGTYLFRANNGNRFYFKVIGYEEDGFIVSHINEDSKLMRLLSSEADKIEKKESEIMDFHFQNN